MIPLVRSRSSNLLASPSFALFLLDLDDSGEKKPQFLIDGIHILLDKLKSWVTKKDVRPKILVEYFCQCMPLLVIRVVQRKNNWIFSDTIFLNMLFRVHLTDIRCSYQKEWIATKLSNHCRRN